MGKCECHDNIGRFTLNGECGDCGRRLEAKDLRPILGRALSRIADLERLVAQDHTRCAVAGCGWHRKSDTFRFPDVGILCHRHAIEHLREDLTSPNGSMWSPEVYADWFQWAQRGLIRTAEQEEASQVWALYGKVTPERYKESQRILRRRSR